MDDSVYIACTAKEALEVGGMLRSCGFHHGDGSVESSDSYFTDFYKYADPYRRCTVQVLPGRKRFRGLDDAHRPEHTLSFESFKRMLFPNAD